MTTEPVQEEFKTFTDPNAEPAEAPKTDAPAPATDAPKADDAPKVEGDADKTDPPAEGEPKTEDPPAPKKQTAQERIAEVTRARREAERRADAAEARLAALDKPKTEDRPITDGEPDPTTFDYGEADPAYIKALARFEARQEFAEQNARQQQNNQIQERDRSWETAQAAARSKYADYDEVVTEGAHEGKWACTPAMSHAIKTSETGPDVAYHLATNPDDARRIAALDAPSQFREMGKLEARLATPPTKEPPKGKTATDAPPPPDGAARGAGGKFAVADDTEDFRSFESKHFPQK